MMIFFVILYNNHATNGFIISDNPPKLNSDVEYWPSIVHLWKLSDLIYILQIIANVIQGSHKPRITSVCSNGILIRCKVYIK